MATLLDILTPELVAGTPEFIASCQTYEGGFGSASFPDWALANGESVSPVSLRPPLFPHQYLLTSTPDGQIQDASAPRPPLGEAHGGYTFCAAASWILLQPYVKTYYPAKGLPAPTINYAGLLRWLTQMQGLEIELGGFKGRTNKLVDGCYSWWVGGCVALVEGFLGIGRSAEGEDTDGDDGEHVWADVDGGLSFVQSFLVLIVVQIHYSIGRRSRNTSSSPDSIAPEVWWISRQSVYSV